MRSEGTMKMAVLEEHVEQSSQGEMKACASLLGQAAEWLRGESVREVQVSATKKRKNREITRIQMTFEVVPIIEGSGMDYCGDLARLYLHFDDNEKG
jgi:hypothetical protein